MDKNLPCKNFKPCRKIQEIFDGEIWISDQKIQYVGPENKEEAAKIAWERQIDAKGKSDHAWI